jgi:hypothetical protein
VSRLWLSSAKTVVHLRRRASLGVIGSCDQRRPWGSLAVNDLSMFETHASMVSR